MNTTIECPRCNGKGNLSHFSHINNGVCFLCEGRKVVTFQQISQEESITWEIKHAIYHDDKGKASQVGVFANLLFHHSNGEIENLMNFQYFKSWNWMEQPDGMTKARDLAEKINESKIGLEHVINSEYWTNTKA